MQEYTETVETSTNDLNDRIQKELQKRKVAKLFQVAEKYGVIKRGYTAVGYLRYAIKNYGWESHAITGDKGSAKSNLLLQRGLAIYKNIKDVETHTVTKRMQLLDHMRNAIDNNERIPWLGVDDIGTLFPASLYFTNRKLYSKLQSTWETVRTVMNCFDFTCTRKNKVANFILEDITGDIVCYNRVGDIKSHYDYRRWLWLRSLKDPTRNIAKLISIEDIPFPLTPDAFKIDRELREGKFLVAGVEYSGEDFYRNHAELMGIERNDFKSYWDQRLDIAKVAFKEFEKLTEEAPAKKQKNIETPPTNISSEEQKEIDSCASIAARNLANKRWQK